MDVTRLAQFVETSGILDNFDMLRMQVPIGMLQLGQASNSRANF
jgi:hypothetical protein